MTPSLRFRVQNAVGSMLEEIELRDIFFFGGLLVAGLGGAQLSRPWTLVVVGAVLALKGHGPLFPSRRGE